MDCPICGALCNLIVIGYDEFGAIKKYGCPECLWEEGEE